MNSVHQWIPWDITSHPVTASIISLWQVKELKKLLSNIFKNWLIHSTLTEYLLYVRCYPTVLSRNITLAPSVLCMCVFRDIKTLKPYSHCCPGHICLPLHILRLFLCPFLFSFFNTQTPILFASSYIRFTLRKTSSINHSPFRNFIVWEGLSQGF